MRKFIMLLFFFFFLSCGIRTFYLKDSIVFKAPLNPRKYVVILPFDNSLHNVIDTDAIYEEFNGIEKTNLNLNENFYSVLRFYPNGCFNIFILNKNRDRLLTNRTLNPIYNGYRGFYNKIDGKIKFDKFGEINQTREFGKLSGVINVKNDTLYVNSEKNNEINIFIKRKIPKELLNFNANW